MMRVFKVYWPGVGCWVECDDQEDAIHDIRRETSGPNTEDADFDRQPELVNQLPALIGGRAEW